MSTIINARSPYYVKYVATQSNRTFGRGANQCFYL